MSGVHQSELHFDRTLDDNLVSFVQSEGGAADQSCE